MAAEALSVSSVFHIFSQKLVQTSVQETVQTIYRPIASVDQSDLEFWIPAEYNIRIFAIVKLTEADENDLVGTNFPAVTIFSIRSSVNARYT